MVAFSALGADASARKTFGKSIEIHVDVDYGVNVGNFIKRLRLSDGPGKSVEKEAVFSVILTNSQGDNLHHHFVGNKLTFVDIGFCLDTYGSLLFNIFLKISPVEI